MSSSRTMTTSPRSSKRAMLVLQDPAAISVAAFDPLGCQCLNLKLVFYTDHNYRVPQTGCDANGTAERPTSGIFPISRGLFEARRALRFKGKDGQAKNWSKNTPA